MRGAGRRGAGGGGPGRGGGRGRLQGPTGQARPGDGRGHGRAHGAAHAAEKVWLIPASHTVLRLTYIVHSRAVPGLPKRETASPPGMPPPPPEPPAFPAAASGATSAPAPFASAAATLLPMSPPLSPPSPLFPPHHHLLPPAPSRTGGPGIPVNPQEVPPFLLQAPSSQPPPFLQAGMLPGHQHLPGTMSSSALHPAAAAAASGDASTQRSSLVTVPKQSRQKRGGGDARTLATPASPVAGILGEETGGNSSIQSHQIR